MLGKLNTISDMDRSLPRPKLVMDLVRALVCRYIGELTVEQLDAILALRNKKPCDLLKPNLTKDCNNAFLLALYNTWVAY